MSYINDVLKPAIADREFPGVVLLARDISGELDIFEAHGFSSLDDAPGDAVPLDRHAVFPLASMTKLMTAVAVLHAAEAGILNLDDDIGELLPELASQPVFKSLDESTTPPTPILSPRTKPLTLRHLLTHSSGCVYDFIPPSPISPYPSISAYFATISPPRSPLASWSGPITSRFSYPLTFEPGEDWAYGTGSDWAGLALERAAGVDLEAYLRKNVWAAVGVEEGSLSFFPEGGAVARMWGSTPVRGEDGKVRHGAVDGPARPPVAQGGEERVCLAGAGLFGEMGEYFKVMVSLLLDDEKILGKEMAKELFRPQLEEGAKKAVNREMGGNSAWLTGWLPPVGIYDHGLAGLLWDGDTEGHRRKGATLWGGMYNPSWIIDRDAGVCAIWATSMLPPGDAKAKEYTRQWEEYVYKLAKK